ncbi:hypothetical protein ACFVWG_29445 [Kribbella sp. NPDC058245]|uniref:hypothetical protein n=1 Tax=Kribbella sp. NPDC058245 TaxID=3346399 RepID=UPI0036E2167B
MSSDVAGFDGAADAAAVPDAVAAARRIGRGRRRGRRGSCRPRLRSLAIWRDIR